MKEKILTAIKSLPSKILSAKKKVGLIVFILLIPLGIFLGFFFAQIKEKALDTFGKTFFAATVDGYPISKKDLERELQSKYKAQALDQLVNLQIIQNKLRNEKIDVTEDEVNARIDQVKSELGGQDLNTVLAEQGLTLEDLKKNLSMQIGLEKSFGGQVVVTQSDIDSYFESFKDTLPGANDDEKKQAAKKQLTDQKLNEVISQWFEQAKQTVKIKKYL